MGKFIGLMSGTSADAIDATIIDLPSGSNKLSVVAYQEFKLASDLQNRLKPFHSSTAQITLEEFSALDQELAYAFSDACLKLLESNNMTASEIDAIGCHGQTIFHQPNLPCQTTLQLGNPNIIAYRTGIKTIADFRRMDMAAGGQGAPLAPGFHQFFFRSNQHNRIILNLGGIANITHLSANKETVVKGWDTGPASALMDEWIKKHRGADFDQNGNWGASGTVNIELLNVMLADQYFSLSAPKSTGREYFNAAWLDEKQVQLSSLITEVDVQATLQHLTVSSVVKSISSLAEKVDQVVVCGGGAYNNALLALLTEYLPDCDVLKSDDLGLPANQVEAVAFAWLAHQRLHNLTGNIPSVTGAAQEVVLGGIYES